VWVEMAINGGPVEAFAATVNSDGCISFAADLFSAGNYTFTAKAKELGPTQVFATTALTVF